MAFPSFAEFYQALNGHKPFRWQEELAMQLCKGIWDWEKPLTMPTAAGKTAILTAWYYSLAYGFHHGKERHIPLRLFFVVNRRILIDSARREGLKIQKALVKSDHPAVKAVAQAVCAGMNIAKPLTIGRMVGGLERGETNKWCTEGTYTPNMPAIVTSSVDHLGSRMLFRSYGDGPKARPIHASMVAVDSLIVVDESHIAQPLLHTLGIIQNEMSSFVEGLPPSRVMEMSATTGDKWSFKITKEDTVLWSRLKAKKPIKLVEMGKEENFEAVMKREAMALLEDGSRKFICVIFNTVDGARKFHSLMAREKSIHSLLLTGRIRDHEKTKILQEHVQPKLKRNGKLKDRNHLMSGRDRSLCKPIVLTATQSLELGVDIDADGMVSEAAPLDSLIQRFGRLDRIGLFLACMGVVVRNDRRRKDEILSDPVYGETPAATFAYLKQFATDGIIPSLRDVPIPEELVVGEEAPSLFCTHPEPIHLSNEVVEQLAFTNSSVAVNLDPYLHGLADNKSASFSIVYRSEITNPMLAEGLSDEKTSQHVKSMLKMARSSIKERLPLPLSVIYKDGTVTDNDDPTGHQPESFNPKVGNQLCVRASDYQIIRLGKVKAGDEVYVPLSFGRYDEYGWNPKVTSPATDIFDQCQDRVIRLHPIMVPKFDLTKCEKERTDKTTILTKGRIFNHVRSIDKMAYKRLVAACKNDYSHHRTPDNLGIYVYSKKKYGKSNQKLLGLEQHQKAAASLVKRICESLGFTEEVTLTLVAAMRFHDLGKSDPRYQGWLYYPEVFDGENYLAKEKIHLKKRRPNLRPLGWRHELQSVSMIIENKLDKVPDPELMLHLVATHHGYNRPAVRPVADPEFQPFLYGKYKSTVPYMEIVGRIDNMKKLQERYGIWGLAFLESIIRLADFKVSHD